VVPTNPIEGIGVVVKHLTQVFLYEMRLVVSFNAIYRVIIVKQEVY
jgi:hypothetical protein